MTWEHNRNTFSADQIPINSSSYMKMTSSELTMLFYLLINPRIGSPQHEPIWPQHWLHSPGFCLLCTLIYTSLQYNPGDGKKKIDSWHLKVRGHNHKKKKKTIVLVCFLVFLPRFCWHYFALKCNMLLIPK